MKNLLKNAAFICLFVFLFFIVQFIFVPKNNTNDYFSISIDEFKERKEDVDVFFVGTSYMAYGVSPMQLYDEYNIVSYNLGSARQPIEVSYFLIQEIYSRGYTPKLIVLEPASCFGVKKEDTFYRFVADKFENDKYKLDLIQTYLKLSDSDNYSIIDWVYYLYPLFNYHTRWEELSKFDFSKVSNNTYFLQGQWLSNSYIVPNYETAENIRIVEKLVIDNEKKQWLNTSSTSLGQGRIEEEPYYISEVDEYNYNYLEKIKQICNEHDTKLLFLKIPTYNNVANYASSWTEQKYQNFLKVANELQVKYIDLTFDNELGMDWVHDSCDAGMHLNLLGVEKVTNFIGKILLEQYKELNCVNDEQYDEKLELYKKYSQILHLELTYTFQDYCAKIKDENLIVIISAKDDMSSGLSDNDIYALKQLGCSADFKSMEYSNSYVAVLSNGVVLYEGVSNKMQFYDFALSTNDISVSSAGYLSGNKSSVLINGIEHSANMRGINFVVYDKESGLIIDSAYCDTYLKNHDVIHTSKNYATSYLDYLMTK